MDTFEFERVIGGLCLGAVTGELTPEELGRAVLELHAERSQVVLEEWAEGL